MRRKKKKKKYKYASNALNYYSIVAIFDNYLYNIRFSDFICYEEFWLILIFRDLDLHAVWRGYLHNFS
ncbi:hypothetical protein BpHYR1_036449 [Brachionus plicatilis]|uniref:Uncharacterized protein n=1 Tax=Brachionus plicatilis TaxID=10195 RepID=A0A3M7SGV2_BRAPC|nr:hypothetical protein BpHYR1_036449 [Brachionus plicatilis]